jgi:hypothetical protein
MTRAGSEIIVAANGVRLGSAHDDSLPEGYVGVVAGALDAGAHLVFDDFAVESPD